jgi:hypothetical protein
LFVAPKPEILSQISGMGFVGGSSYARTSKVVGNAVQKAILGKEKL